MYEGILIMSSNRGRYAFQDAPEGPYGDLTSGDRCEILLGGHWIAGSIEHSGSIYVDEDLPYKAHRGYFFVADADRRPCGLCLGMKVRMP